MVNVYWYTTRNSTKQTKLRGVCSTCISCWDVTSIDSTDYWSNHTTYEYINSYTVRFTSKEVEQKIKKLLKRMTDEMCKEGWIHHIPYYPNFQLKPINLRGVRLEGRGWANKLK